jgi:hypothetical protein
MSTIRFMSYPRTAKPPKFIFEVVQVFIEHEASISTTELQKGLESNQVLSRISSKLVDIGFEIEVDKNSKLARPVFFGENGSASLRYDIDGYHSGWKCGIEVEAGRSILGNAIFRDLFQAMVMVDVDQLIIAVPNVYKHLSNKKPVKVECYKKAVSVADALYGHDRMKMPYGLTILGY